MMEEYRLKTMKTTGPNPSPLYISRIRLSIKFPIFKRISPNPYLLTRCDSLHLSLYRRPLSRSLPIIPTRGHMRSHDASSLFISYLRDAPSLISLPVHSYHVARSSLLHDVPIVTCLLHDLVRCLHDHEP